ncbi:WD40 repeat-like protein [Glonium stellatum]|uniref:WD40 repeat-like protein n=1 Tax=Glonium stellatum TaxID=574774 RepID=A0A8E2EMB4_9PEZI|nr:WD40 repeat-like protein [Glonium stellatum]
MELDNIYIHVLQHCLQRISNENNKSSISAFIKQCIGPIVILFNPLSVAAVSNLVNIDQRLLQKILDHLRSILDIPNDRTSPVRLHHPSFRDFYLDKLRCFDLQFCVDEKQAHRTLGDNCIRLLSTSLKQDIFGLDDPGWLVANMERGQIDQVLLSEVQYACLYWVQHLQKGDAELHDNDQVHRFLREHLLHWLEALGWMRKTTEGILAITSLESIALASDCPHLYAFIYDSKRFALYNRLAIEQAPLQVYYSGLAFAPATSLVRKQFKDKALRWISRLPSGRKDWSALLQTLEGHENSVLAVAFSPDGKQLASCDHSTIRLWDRVTGATLQTLRDYTHPHAIAFTPDSKRLISVPLMFALVKIWDTATGALLQVHEVCPAFVFSGGQAISWDGKYAALAGSDKIRLLDTAAGAVLQTLDTRTGAIMRVIFSRDGKRLVLAFETTVKILDVSVGATLQTLEDHTGLIDAITFSPDGKQLAFVSRSLIEVWDIATGAALQTLTYFNNECPDVVFSPDSKQLAYASGGYTVKLWDIATGVVLQSLKGHVDKICTFIFSSDGSSWHPHRATSLEGPVDAVCAVVFSSDSKQLASASRDGTVKLWDMTVRAALDTPKGLPYPIKAVAFSPGGKQVASVSRNTVKLWDAATGRTLKILDVSQGLEWYGRIAYSPDNELLMWSPYEAVRLRKAATRAATGAALRTFEDYEYWISAVGFSPDGKQLAFALFDETVQL